MPNAQCPMLDLHREQWPTNTFELSIVPGSAEDMALSKKTAPTIERDEDGGVVIKR